MTTFPDNPSVGDTFYDPDINEYFQWDGIAWVTIGGGTSYADAVAAGADFPSNPNVGDIYDYLGSYWQWDGVS